MVSAEENTYFLRAFEALGVSEARRAADPDTQATIGFNAIMREAADTRSYAAALSVLVVAEWLYLDWASRAPQRPPNNFVHAEWITLHDNPNFRGFVDFLRAELDRVGPAQADLCRDFLHRAVGLELSFFDRSGREELLRVVRLVGLAIGGCCTDADLYVGARNSLEAAIRGGAGVSQCAATAPSRDRWFESGSLQQRVCKLLAPWLY